VLRSFSRRLGFLNDCAEARHIAERWLKVDGLLGDVAALNDLGKEMFENVAPLLPQATLAAIERAFGPADVADHEIPLHAGSHLNLIRLLAYDSDLFESSIALILRLAEADDPDDFPPSNEASRIFKSLFYICLSGTHATIEQRLKVIEPLLASSITKRRELGLAGLRAALEAWQFNSTYSFDFGARSRDYGFWPKNVDEARQWFGATLQIATRFACSHEPVAAGVRAAVADAFRGLWLRSGAISELEKACHEIAAEGHWPEGWRAVRQTQHYDSNGLSPELLTRLASLEELLRPKNLIEEVRSLVLGTADYEAVPDHPSDSPSAARFRAQSRARDLGKSVAVREDAFQALAPELLSGQNLVWHFGVGLAEGAEDPMASWNRLAAVLGSLPEKARRIDLLLGFVKGLHARDAPLCDRLLDDAVTQELLAAWFPALQATLKVDRTAVARLMCALHLGKAPIANYRALESGGVIEDTEPSALREFLLRLSAQPDGTDVAIEILSMRIYSDEYHKREHAPDVLSTGRELLSKVIFSDREVSGDYHLG